ncbi:RNA polymerase sigma factor [Saccharopolyspora gregorii]|uniref:RNA polymerase sigma factor n=1 Tax=Saccharopolyspora gregorii TaxID=33914 RepID=UPI0031E8E283
MRRPFPGSPSIVEAPSERHRRQQATTRRDPGAPAFRAGGMTAAVRVPQPLTGDAAWELVERAQRGDRIAFGRLYERYRPLVSNFLCARIHDFSTVEDLVHETFARALHNIRTVRRGSDDPARGSSPSPATCCWITSSPRATAARSSPPTSTRTGAAPTRWRTWCWTG